MPNHEQGFGYKSTQGVERIETTMEQVYRGKQDQAAVQTHVYASPQRASKIK